MEEDFSLEGNLRPQTLDEYIGQEKTKNTLKIYIEAAKQRHDSLDHVLFYGPPGLGKTTLSGIIANEMGVHMKVTSGPAIEKPGEMAAILNNLQEGDILFVDEIHRLNRQVEEVLYPAMEDFAIDIMIGKGASARSIRLDLPRFTLVGATTRAGLLSAPLRDRFGVIHHLEFYSKKELTTIIMRSAQVLGVEIDVKGAGEIAMRSRGTPRLANRLLKRVRDFAQVKYDGRITYDVACFALNLLEVDQYGLDKLDRQILTTLIVNFKGGPVGLETLAAAIGEDSGTLEDVYEPYLLKKKPCDRTEFLSYMKRFGIYEEHVKRYPAELSGGELQRMALARAMLMEPECLILDEPTSMLDMVSQAQMIRLLEQLQAETGVAYLFISHDRELCRKFCSRIHQLEQGRFTKTWTRAAGNELQKDLQAAGNELQK